MNSSRSYEFLTSWKQKHFYLVLATWITSAGCMCWSVVNALTSQYFVENSTFKIIFIFTLHFTELVCHFRTAVVLLNHQRRFAFSRNFYVFSNVQEKTSKKSLNTPNYSSSKINNHRFKNLTFLKTRDKTTLNLIKSSPHPLYGGS